MKKDSTVILFLVILLVLVALWQLTPTKKDLVLKLVFEERLAYNRKSGFETALLSLPLRVFTLPEAQNAYLVEMGVMKPRSERFE